jgi:hypothetical protein
MVSKQNVPQQKPQDQAKHAESEEAVLNPNRGAGQTATSRQARTRPASEIKAVSRALQDFTFDELRQIPITEAGSHLRHGGVYIDLSDPTRGEFRVVTDVVASQDNAFVAKHDVAYPLWNRLVESHARVERDAATRSIEQGSNELRGGSERSERRGAGAVGSTRGSPRH